MAEETRPLVAIVGGFYALGPDDIDAASDTGKQLGAALARAGFNIVVYFSDDQALEPHVVSGYVSALGDAAQPGSIMIRYAETQRGQVQFAEEASRKELFRHRIFPGRDWEAPFYRSLVEADGVDAVLLVAGGRSTLIAGQVAVARRMPTLAIDRFEGSARAIWNELARDSEDYPSWSTHEPAGIVAWLKAACAAHAQLREEARHQAIMYEKYTSQRVKSRWATAAFVILLTTLFFGVAAPPDPSFYPFLLFAGLVAAGATGALVRAVFWGSKEVAPTVSLLLGGVAGFVVGLAYLVPQWIGAPGLLETGASAVDATDKIQFVSAVLVALSAGVGFDTVFARLRQQAEDTPITAPG